MPVIRLAGSITSGIQEIVTTDQLKGTIMFNHVHYGVHPTPWVAGGKHRVGLLSSAHTVPEGITP